MAKAAKDKEDLFSKLLGRKFSEIASANAQKTLVVEKERVTKEKTPVSPPANESQNVVPKVETKIEGPKESPKKEVKFAAGLENPSESAGKPDDPIKPAETPVKRAESPTKPATKLKVASKKKAVKGLVEITNLTPDGKCLTVAHSGKGEDSYNLLN